MSNVPVGRAIDGEPITIYDPGTRSWTVIHVIHVARAFMDSFEHLEEQLEVCETGVTTSPISSDEDQSVGAIAETVQQITMTDDPESAVELLENQLRGETIVAEDAVDIARMPEEMDWHPFENSSHRLSAGPTPWSRRVGRRSALIIASVTSGTTPSFFYVDRTGEID